VLGFLGVYARRTGLDVGGWVPTLVTASPVASPVAHLFLHVTAVLHSPETDLFLPPHRERE